MHRRPRAPRDHRPPPRPCRAAPDLAARSDRLRDAPGADVLKIYLAIKEQACARFSSEVSELDYSWYLRS